MPLKVTRRSRYMLVFAYKHDGCDKAWLVAAGNLIPHPLDSIYSGVV